MALLFTLVGITAASFAAFWGVTLFAQRYLYSEPADMLPLRAAVAGLLLGCFMSAWVYINTRADGENKYGVIHQFTPNSTSDPVTTFKAERKKLDPQLKPVGDETVTFERQTTDDGLRYMPTDPKPNGQPKPFAVTSSTHYTVALVIDDGGEPVRYEAVLNDKQQYTGEKYTFQEKGGGRSIEISRGENTSPNEAVAVISPSGGAVFVAILLNVLHLVIWFAIFWPVLRFNVGHALGFTVVCFALSTVILMPLLFQANAVSKTTITPATATAKQ